MLVWGEWAFRGGGGQNRGAPGGGRDWTGFTTLDCGGLQDERPTMIPQLNVETSTEAIGLL